MVSVKNIFFYVIKRWKIIIAITLIAIGIGVARSAYGAKIINNGENEKKFYTNRLTIYLPGAITVEENIYFNNTVKPIAAALCKQYMDYYADKIIVVDSGSILIVEMESEYSSDGNDESAAILLQLGNEIIYNIEKADERYGVSLGNVDAILTTYANSTGEALMPLEDKTVDSEDEFSLSAIFKNAAKYGLVGFILIIILLIFIYLISNNVKSLEDLETNFNNIPVCGAIRKGKQYNYDINQAILNLKYQLKNKVKNEWIFTGIPDKELYNKLYLDVFDSFKAFLSLNDKNTNNTSEENSDNNKSIVLRPSGQLNESFYNECRVAGGIIIMLISNVTKLDTLSTFIYNLEMQDIKPLAFILIEN